MYGVGYSPSLSYNTLEHTSSRLKHGLHCVSWTLKHGQSSPCYMYKSVISQWRCSQIRAKNYTPTTRRQCKNMEATEVVSKLPSNLQRAMEVSTEKGALTWLTTLPGNFQAWVCPLCLRYSWCPQQLPSWCVCKQKFTWAFNTP